MLETLQQPWPWWVVGPSITLIMFLLLYSGKRFGLSSTLKTSCSAVGAGRFSSFFRDEWKSDLWNLVFVAGTIIGGLIASQYLLPVQTVALSPETVASLEGLGVEQPGAAFLPVEIFNWDNLFTLQGFLIMIVGGFLVGFGARYADGCTSGHAISGLSNLQLPSLIAVIGFFIGGLLTTYLILPYLLSI
jgi:uncharacterized membrane protein YedE/YeeE